MELGSCPEIDEGKGWHYLRNVWVTSLDCISPFAVEPAGGGEPVNDVVADAVEAELGRISGYSSFSSSYHQQYQLPLVMVRNELS